MDNINTEIFLGKGTLTITLKHSPLGMNTIKEALRDARPSGVGRFYSIKKGVFDSSIEWSRAVWLYDLQRRGVITDLSHHSTFTFKSDSDVMVYESDFTYYCNNRLYIEEVKPGKIRVCHAHKDSAMVVASEYSTTNKHIKLLTYDTHVRRVHFILSCANLQLHLIPIIGSAKFFSDTGFLCRSWSMN